LADAAAEVWPTRHNRKVKVLDMAVTTTPRLGSDELVKLVTQIAQNKAPTTIKEVLSRYGVDELLVETLGGLKEFMRSLEPEEMQYWTEVRAKTELPRWAKHEDPAVQSYLSDSLGGRMQQMVKLDFNQPLSGYSVVVAGNAGGKSTAMASTMAGRVIDMDEVFRQAGVNKLIKQSKDLHSKQLPKEVVVRTAHVLAQTPGHILLTQYPITWLEQILQTINALVAAVFVVYTNSDTVWERVTIDRAWSYLKVERRVNRFRKTAAAYEQKYPHTKASSVLEAIAQCT